MPTTQREMRYLTTAELTRLRRFADNRATQAMTTEAVTAVRSWAFLDSVLSSGLRASEVATLHVGDCMLGYGQTSLIVQNGKGSEAREVFISDELKRHLKAFITWKRDRGEYVSDAAPLFTGQRGARTRNGVWRLVKELMAAVGPDPRYATLVPAHSRDTLVPSQRGDLEVVQKQLGHASIQLTVDTYGKWLPMGNKSAVDRLDFPGSATGSEQSGSHRGSHTGGRRGKS